MPGTYGLTVTDEGGCSGAAEVIVSLADSLSTTILGSSTFCPGSFSVLTGASGFAAYEWSTGSTDSSITVSEAGDYRLTVTDASGCSGSAGISVSESASLSPVINGGLLFCQGDSSVIGVGDFATYAWSTGDTSQQITVTAEGVYEVSVSDGQGCTGSSQVSVQVQDLPDLQITGQTSFCPGEATVLDAGAGFNSYEWSEGSTTQTISVNAEGVFSVTVTDEAGCKATNEVLISFDLPEMAMVAPAPGGCADTLVLMANLPPGTTGRWTSSDTSLAILDPTSGTTRLTGLAGTPATLTWTLSTQDCPDYSSDEVTIHPDQGPLATDDQAGMAATTRSVSINLIANDQLFGAGTFDLRLLSEPVIGTVVGLENGILIYAAPAGAFGTEVLTYELCVEGCPCSFATITILIEAGQIEEVEAGNTITPNGDGFNDSFVFDIIRSTPPEAIPDNELIIFNRWGDIVFQMEGYDNNWNGVNSRGEDLPEATYYYILRLNIGEGMVLRGDITIIR
jgi:gliding motility-associated-like protein